MRRLLEGVRAWWTSPARRALAGRALAWIALAAILVHGALLRLDAITGRYGPVTSPSWIAAIQNRSVLAPTEIRPRSIVWELEPIFPHRDGSVARYRSDPHTYLDTARNMTWFYQGHQREPVFPFVTRLFLWLLHGQDVAVSFASMLFSLLAVWFTYLLGASLWSRPVGLLAALGLSIDMDLVSLASLGWRDDAYMAMAVLSALLMLRWWRADPPGTRATYTAAAWAGVGAGFAMLTRITAVTFLVPGIIWLFVERRAGWRRQLVAVALWAAVTLVVAGPFFINVWRVLGDPFYSFNVHGSVYSLAEGQAEYTGGTVGYITQKFSRRPVLMFDTVAQGLTTYPFLNKWGGFMSWLEGLWRWAAALSVIGLVILAALPAGRLLLAIAVGSILPFAFTWTVDPDYRFTVQAYPFLLIATGVALSAMARTVGRVLGSRAAEGAPPAWWREPWRPWAAVVVPTVIVIWLVGRVLPPRVFAEALRAGEDATVMAGARDAAFLGSGWSALLPGSNVSFRTTSEGDLTIRLPLEGDYPVTLRMDPFPRPLAAAAPAPLPVVEMWLNGTSVAAIQLEWTPDRVGTYRVVLPQAAVRRGTNRLMLRVRPAASGDRPEIALWYLRVHPRQTASAIAQRRASPRAVRRPEAGSIQIPSNEPMPQFQGFTTSSASPR